MMDLKKRPATHFEAVEKLDKQAAAEEVQALFEAIQGAKDARLDCFFSPETKTALFSTG